MTIENTTRSVRTQGNNATTVFDYNFLIPTGTLVVILYDAAAETYTKLAASEYSATGLDNVNGGTVTYPLTGTPITSSQYLIIRRDVPYTQPLDIANQGGFFADTVMEQLDRTAMMAQQLAEVQARSLITIEGEEFARPMPIKSALAGNTLAFDANGEPTAGPSVGEVSAAGTYAQQAIDAAAAAKTSETNAAASAATIEIGSGSDLSVDPNKLAKRGDVKTYADTKAPLKTSITGQFDEDSRPGGAYAGYAFNEWRILDDAVVGDQPAAANQGYGILLDYIAGGGGGTLRGTRNAMSAYMTLAAPSENAAGANQNYVALQAIGQAVSGDNGTDTGAGAKGAIFAINPVAQINGTATNLLHLSCGEINIGAVAGTSMRHKSMFNFANYPNDAVKGADTDAIMWFYSQGTDAVGFDYGFLFSNEVGGISSVQLLDTTGTIMAAKGDGTCAMAFDFTDWNFTTAVFRSRGFQIDKDGNVAGGTWHGLSAAGASATLTTPVLPDAQADPLGSILFGYQNQSTFVDSITASIRAVADAAWTGGNGPSLLRFYVAGTTGPETEQMRLAPSTGAANKSSLWINEAGTLLQVEIGSNDSESAGYRNLRVVNAA